jgi:hypothetical protein
MATNNHAVFFRIILVIVVAITLSWSSRPLLAQAGPDLPPRDTPAPTPQPKKDRDSDQPVGAHLELQVQPSQPGLWAVVQWQDSAGNWHDVEGWQGRLNSSGWQQWWVAAKDFGTGPFRWVIKRELTSPPLAASSSFSLPDRANAVRQIEVSLAAEP